MTELPITTDMASMEPMDETELQGIVAGELEELETSFKINVQANQDFYSELLGYAKMRSYKEGWAAFKYKEKYGVFPNGLSKAFKPPTRATINYITSRNIAFAKSRRAN